MVHRLTAIGGFLRYVGHGREGGKDRFVERGERDGGGEEIRLN